MVLLKILFYFYSSASAAVIWDLWTQKIGRWFCLNRIGFLCNRWPAPVGLGLCFLMIDREITLSLTSVDRHLFMDARVTQELNVFLSQTNFLNTELDKVSADSRVIAWMWVTGKADNNHTQILIPYSSSLAAPLLLAAIKKPGQTRLRW